jgi:hypothetical protein
MLGATCANIYHLVTLRFNEGPKLSPHHICLLYRTSTFNRLIMWNAARNLKGTQLAAQFL